MILSSSTHVVAKVPRTVRCCDGGGIEAAVADLFRDEMAVDYPCKSSMLLCFPGHRQLGKCKITIGRAVIQDIISGDGIV